MQSSTEFMEHIKIKTVPCGYHLISFDVIFLFTNVPLDATIDIALKRIYDNREINTTINKREMKKLIKLCMKVVHFNFNGTTYVLKDRVAMGSPLAPVLAGIFMVELERAVIPNYHNIFNFGNMPMAPSVLFVMDTKNLCCHVFNNFHNSNNFKYEIEKKKKKYPFLMS